VVAADTVAYETLVDLVREAGEGLVESIELLDVYRGEHIESDKRSLTLGIVFRSREKTLTEDEVNAVLSAMKDALSREVNATFR
jgi:phenylalanyl-tRNA synthetase beta chain